MIDRLHERGVGVLLDWVPSHFPMDEHALFRFDGTYLYEHADPRQGFHPDWKSAIFNYGRPEVRSFLVSSAISWLERYHADGLRVDAVASMLYLDYSRSEGQWMPNRYGGRENLAAIDFLKQCNTAIAEEFPDTDDVRRGVDGVAAGHGVGRRRRARVRLQVGHGLDARRVAVPRPRTGAPPLPPRRDHVPQHVRLRRALRPAALPRRGGPRQGLAARQDARRRVAALRQPAPAVRHDVGAAGQEAAVHGRRAGAPWRSGPTRGRSTGRSTTRPTTTACAASSPTSTPPYQGEPALHRGDCDAAGFRYVVGDDDTHSVFAWLRLDPTGESPVVLVVANATPAVHYGYRVGVPEAGEWTEILNTDAADYGGSGVGNLGVVATEDQQWHGFPQSLALTVPPLAVVYLRQHP